MEPNKRICRISFVQSRANRLVCIELGCSFLRAPRQALCTGLLCFFVGGARKRMVVVLVFGLSRG